MTVNGYENQKKNRNRMAIFRRISCVCLALFFLIGLLLTNRATVWAKENETVKVGVFPLGNFHNYDEYGHVYGYDIDYIKKISEITHWNIEYVEVENWVEATDMLENGEIDLLAPAQKIDSLSEQFDYAAFPMGTEFAAIYTQAGRDDLQYEDFGKMAELTYGAVKESTFTTEFLEDYVVDVGFTPDIQYYGNTTELFDALYAGEVDAIVTNVMFYDESIKMLAKFSALPVYYITQKGNTDLLEELNEAMTTIRLNDPSFEAELMAEYFQIFNSTQLTYEEQQYVESMQEIKVGYMVNHEPLSYTDPKTGEFAGISRDILDRISEITGFTFSYVPLPATDVTAEYLREHDIHVICNVEYNETNASLSIMKISSPYLESEKVIVAKNDIEFDSESALKIALATGSATVEDVIKKEYPNFSFEIYGTMEECYEAVRTGKADALMDNRYVVETLLNKPIYQDMSVIPIQGLTDKLCLGTMIFEEDDIYADTMFLQIVDKAILQLTTKEVNNIIIRNTAGNVYQLTLMDIAYAYRHLWVVIILLLACIMGLLIWTRQIKAKKNEELQQKNRELVLAIEQAQRANHAKSQFLSRMSHEIRTPMNAIVGFTAIAKKNENDAGKINEYLEKIEVSSKVLLNIINDVLDMSAIESAKLKIAHTEFNLKNVLEGIKSIYQAQCRQKGIGFEITTDIRHENLLGDPLRMNQILLNLVSNAYKFTEKGSITIRVKETEQKNNLAFFRIEVKDTGIGMSEEMKQRLFKPFEQESADTTQKYGGSGLGLSIMKNLVEMMHGAVSVTSEKGKGSCFIVDISFEIAEDTEDLSYSEKIQFDFSGKRVLLVEDTEFNREIALDLLEMVNVSVDTAVDGKEAIEKFEASEKGTYDLILMDIQMPIMNGYEATGIIRKSRHPDAENIPIYAMTADAFTEDVSMALSAGMDGHIAKPIDAKLLYQTIDRIFRKYQK